MVSIGKKITSFTLHFRQMLVVDVTLKNTGAHTVTANSKIRTTLVALIAKFYIDNFPHNPSLAMRPRVATDWVSQRHVAHTAICQLVAPDCALSVP